MAKNTNINDEEVLPYEPEFQIGVDDVFGTTHRQNVEQKSGRGNSRKTISNLFSGFNHRMAPLYVPKNLDSTGYTFFTRPDLNLNEENVLNSRRIREMFPGSKYHCDARSIV